ncbi:MAG TPA: ammonium transporter [Nitrospirales bacterium]|nr:ammonium transporter [Nitrospirales bacterium]
MSTPGEESIAWLLIATPLVLLTIPGVALLYGGMVRRKNIVNTIGLTFLSLLVASIMGAVMIGLMPAVQVAERLQRFQVVLGGALALALTAGSIVERVSWRFFAVFGTLWLALIYWPLAQSVWGSGWLNHLGVLDYAGAGPIHLAAGVSALVAAVQIGPRVGYGRHEMMPSSLPLTVCGAGLLWIGWCGMAGGFLTSTMATRAGALVAIQCAASSAALTWTAAEWLQRDKPTVLGTVSGAIAGLIGISAGAGYVGPLAALVIGAGAGAACYMAVNFVKPILRYDDSLDVFGMHGVAGAWSVLATGLFASATVNPSGSDGLFYGYPYQLFAEAASVLVVVSVAGIGTALLIKLLSVVLPARVAPDAEMLGLDLSQHGERGYS